MENQETAAETAVATRRRVGRRLIRRAALLTASISTSAVLVIASGGNASAASGSYISSNSGGANMRTCASTSCGAVTYLGNGTGVYMLCWVDGAYAVGNYGSARWFYVGLFYDNRAGYVHSSLVSNQTSVRHC